MSNRSLGVIEVLGLAAAVEAADVACKTADVQLIGYETTDGMGMVAVKIEGQVSAVTAAVAAASAAAARISKVFATSVIARPSDQLPPIVFTKETVGLARPKVAEAPKPKPAPEPEPVAEPPVEPEETVLEPPAETLVEPVETTPEPSPAPELSEPQVAMTTTDSDKSEIATPKRPPAARRPPAPKSRPTKK